MEVHGKQLHKLELEEFSKAACIAAIKGERVPDALGLPLLRLCTIRGIRYNQGFGEELRGILPVFTRALNARAIMSNSIPDLSVASDIPYCFWHPQVPSEDTCRQLIRLYPSTAYQVARVCAVGGYTQLYKELDILPEVHVAEEARESGNTEIFELIFYQPDRYSIMDDYTRTLNVQDPRKADLNGDTSVSWSLNLKQQFGTVSVDDFLAGEGFRERYFNITEDMNVDVFETSLEHRPQPAHAILAELLTTPLPRDLPIIDKDLLILMAAYYGDIERYSRLQRPQMVDRELQCCMRGVYHNTMFAVWWSKQDRSRIQGSASMLIQAIEARFIMNNVLARVKSAHFEAPYLIWYPSIAKATTYRKLYELQPDMLPQVMRAAIVANYRQLFDDLIEQATPDQALFAEAARCGTSHYTQALTVRSQQLGTMTLPTEVSWKMENTHSLEESSDEVVKWLSLAQPGGDFAMLYNGRQCDAGTIELIACLPEHWRIPHDDEDYRKTLDYNHWPPTEAK